VVGVEALKRFFAKLGILGMLATVSAMGTTVATAPTVGACGWYVAASQVKYSSYYNYALGSYAYIGFEAVVMSDGCGNEYGYTYVWDTAGFAMSGGTVEERSDFQGGGGWNTHTQSANGSTSVYIQGWRLSWGVMWTDDAGTNVRDAFGGLHGVYVTASH
jgi:hypothetical protein